MKLLAAFFVLVQSMPLFAQISEHHFSITNDLLKAESNPQFMAQNFKNVKSIQIEKTTSKVIDLIFEAAVGVDAALSVMTLGNYEFEIANRSYVKLTITQDDGKVVVIDECSYKESGRKMMLNCDDTFKKYTVRNTKSISLDRDDLSAQYKPVGLEVADGHRFEPVKALNVHRTNVSSKGKKILNQ